NPHLQTATDKMQEARAALADKQRDAAAARQAEAVENLQKSRAAIQEQLAKAELNKPQPTDPLAKLKQLQKDTRELMANQDQVRKESLAAKNVEGLQAEAPKQAGLKEKTQDLQRQSAPASPAAAKSLAEAANQMNKAEK